TAAIGGIGAIGIISEVTVQAVERFNIEQDCELQDIDWVEASFEKIFQDNEHMSLYVFPFTRKVQVNRWNPTTKPQTAGGPWKEWLSISFDALGSAWLVGGLAYLGLLKPIAGTLYKAFKHHLNLVLESAEGYSRSIYHNHQELEFTVPYEDTIPMIRRLL